MILLIFLAVGVERYHHYLATPLTGFTEPVTLRFEPGTPLREISRRLAEANVLPSARPFVGIAWYQGKASRIQAGEYRFEPGITPQRLLDRLIEGDTIKHRLTLVEGWNFKDLLAALANHEAINHSLQGLSAQEVMARLGYPGQHPEGRFYPDTYLFTRGESDVAILRQAYDAMSRLVAEEWAARAPDLPIKTPEEAVILASIVEKETGLAEERPRIAGVFIQRLRKRMLLQTDPTIIYGLGDHFDGDLRRKHLRDDGPYNTYRRPGLPPTPIAMPGKEALRAALHPLESTELYFVAKGGGAHAFSSTLAEHEKNVTCYQLHRCKGK